MAYVVREPNGRMRIALRGLDNKRPSIRLGVVSEDEAQAVAAHITTILDAAKVGVILDGCDNRQLSALPARMRAQAVLTATWLQDLPADLRRKMHAVGLLHSPEATPATDQGALADSRTLGEFLAGFIAKKADVKPATRYVFERVRKKLVEFFGAERPLDTITAGAACDFRQSLIGNERLAENTIRRHCGIARQFFKSAVKHKLIAENPFSDDEIKVSVKGNPDKFYFVTEAEAQAVLAACPNAEWRLLFALSRYGGLRCPSEHLALKWGHIDWANERIVVPSPKTAHHEGKAERVMPLFPQLRPHLEAVYQAAPAGTEWVITRYRSPGTNLRTQFERILTKAGLKAWPKLFHNLRATRQTELSDQFPAHVVSAWLGNSVEVAREHYLRTTDEHFARAVQQAAPAVPEPQPDARSDAPEPVRQAPPTPAEFGTIKKPVGKRKTPAETGVLMGDRGLEPLTSTMSTLRSNQLS
jgi:integrase